MKIKRAWIITDTHFGVKSNKTEWVKIQNDYFWNTFIPDLENNYQEGDALIHCGDVFDNRNSLNLLVMNEALKIFKKLSSLLPVYIVIGNHDIYKSASNDINSLVLLENLPNINIIYNYDYLTGSKEQTLCLMGWQNTYEQEVNLLKSLSGDYLFCHSDVKGAKFNKDVNISTGKDKSAFKNFKKVLTGHIHFKQDYDNIKFLGTPYELTRSDADNPKGYHILNFDTDEIYFYKNERSPKYIQITYDEYKSKTTDEIEELFNNNFVDIKVKNFEEVDIPIENLNETFKSARSIQILPDTATSEVEALNESQTIEQNFSVIDYIYKYVDKNTKKFETESGNVSEKIKASCLKLYKEATGDIQ
jgi:DNA repair exonuclease SbcCD nuclease subunit